MVYIWRTRIVSYICELSELKEFINTANPNDKFIYYTGFSLTDSIMAKELKRVTYEYATKGEVYLVQKRFQGAFDFIVIKASRPPMYKLVPLSDEKLRETVRPHRVDPLKRKVRYYEYYTD